MKRLYPVGQFAHFEDDEYEKNIQGSNCYSYAFNHFALNGQRPHKSVPGFITEYVTNKKYPDTDWQVCTRDIIERVLDDGKTASKMYNLRADTIKEVKGKTTVSKLMKKPEASYRRVVMVLAPGGTRGVPTDFHFYAQRGIPVRELYNTKLSTYTTNNIDKTMNPYIMSGIHPTMSHLQIHRKYLEGNKHAHVFINTVDDPHKRARLNIELHNRVMPQHMRSFVPDPFWLLDIPVHEQKQTNVNMCVKRKAMLLKGELPRFARIIDAAKDAALKKKVFPADKYIGIWMHKLGWGTKPLNTDGDGKLIFDPIQANKCHGGYDYKTVCGVFDVMVGYGITSPWHDIRRFKKNNSV